MIHLQKNKKKFDIITLGRACIDLNSAEYNRPMEETLVFNKYVGGSPVNIAIGCKILGLNVGFIGKISDDQHGNYVYQTLNEKGIDISQIKRDSQNHKMGLTFTEIKSPKECSILMYREEVADLYLRPEEISEQYIKDSEALLISGTALAQSPSREATLLAVDYAKKNRVKVIFELDYRPYNWKSTMETAIYYQLVAKKADIIIGTKEEYEYLFHEKKEDEAIVKELFTSLVNLIVIKYGIQGSKAFIREGETFQAGIYKSKVLKTFGAGDSFASAFIFALFNEKNISEALDYASASASIVISQLSSSEAMPTEKEIIKKINENGK